MIYPYLSYRREINETDVNYTLNLQKVWDSSDSLNGNSCSLLIFIRSGYKWMISRDFLTRWNAINVRKGREKGQFWGISYFWIEVFLKEVFGLSSYLRKEPASFPTFQVKTKLFVNFIAVRKYNFLDSLFGLFCTVLCKKIFALTIQNIIPLEWKDVSVTNADIFDKEQFSLQFFYSLLQVYIVHRVSFIFHLNAFAR